MWWKLKDQQDIDPSSVRVVNEYLNIFSKEMLGLPPERELKFSLDFLLGTTLISKAPCRMAPVKFQELNV